MIARILLTLVCCLAPLSARAGLVFYANPGSGPYCALFDDADSTEVDFTEGTGQNVGRFAIADAAIVTASLDAGTYTARVFANTAASLVVATDLAVGAVARFVWDGTTDITDDVDVTLTEDDIDDIVAGVIEGGGAISPVDPDIITETRTWIARGRRATNIVELTQGFIGTLALKPDLNTATTILTVSAVSITGAATVTATDLSVDRSRTQAHFTVPALTTTGTYTVVVTVTTVDGQTIKTTGTLKVYQP